MRTLLGNKNRWEIALCFIHFDSDLLHMNLTSIAPIVRWVLNVTLHAVVATIAFAYRMMGLGGHQLCFTLPPFSFCLWGQFSVTFPRLPVMLGKLQEEKECFYTTSVVVSTS